MSASGATWWRRGGPHTCIESRLGGEELSRGVGGVRHSRDAYASEDDSQMKQELAEWTEAEIGRLLMGFAAASGIRG